jgi:hypothetical protein
VSQLGLLTVSPRTAINNGVSTDSVIIVSTDGHPARRRRPFRDYIEKRYQPALDDLGAENEQFSRLLVKMQGYPAEARSSMIRTPTLVRREPIGVCGAITPWNIPRPPPR